MPNLRCYHHWDLTADKERLFHWGFPTDEYLTRDTTGAELQQALAHRHGDAGHDALTERSPCGAYDTTEDILNDEIPCRYHCRRQRDRQEFAYRFLEFDPEDAGDAYPSLTNRIVRASSGPCLSYNQSGLERPDLPDPLDQRVSVWNYTYTNSSNFTGTITIPVKLDTINGTTYVYCELDIQQHVNPS